MYTIVNILKMNKRFKLWLDSEGLNANLLSKLVDLNRSSIHIVNGRNKNVLKKYYLFIKFKFKLVDNWLWNYAY